MMNAVEKTFEEIQTGETASLQKTITAGDVEKFAEVSGDQNPLHMEETYAETTTFKGRIVHGMYLGALVSQLIGMKLPGKKALLLKESLEFKKPARINDTITVTGTVAHKTEALKLLEILIEIRTENELLAKGTVHVQVLS